jgi:hypothetical protein
MEYDASADTTMKSHGKRQLDDSTVENGDHPAKRVKFDQDGQDDEQDGEKPKKKKKKHAEE